MRFLLYLGILFSIGATSCASGDTPAPATAPQTAATSAEDRETPADQTQPTPGEARAAPSFPAWQTGDSNYIFDQGRLHTYEITVPPELLAEIDADPSAEEWVEASLAFEGQFVGAVGLRYKGSIGAFVNCLTGTNPLQPSGAKRCTKLSMKVKINWDESDTRFYRLKRLQFHSMNNDPSQMRERLGYWLFAEMGVPSPRSVHARVVINGEFVGLFALTEQIDGRFTRERFADGTGNLYKEVWPTSYGGNAHADQVYLDALKTNEDENPTVDLIRDFAQEISSATEWDGEHQEVIEEFMVVEEAVAYAVVDRTIRHDDGPFHWYCFAVTQCEPHNFYWYENPSDQKLHLIPWDLDNAFENLTDDANPITPIADGWGEVSNDCEPFTAPGGFIAQRSAACDPLVAALVAFDEEYDRVLAAFLGGPADQASVEELVATWAAQISDATREASAAHHDAISVERWRNAVDRLLADFASVHR